MQHIESSNSVSESRNAT